MQKQKLKIFQNEIKINKVIDKPTKKTLIKVSMSPSPTPIPEPMASKMKKEAFDTMKKSFSEKIGKKIFEKYKMTKGNGKG